MQVPSHTAAVSCGDERPKPAWAPSAVAAAVLFAVSLMLLLIVFLAFSQHPWSMLDLRVYLWGGSTARHAKDPYLHTYLRHSLPFTYTPMAVGFFALVATINLQIMKVIVTAASVASLLGVLWLTWGALGHRRSRGRLSATLAVAAVALWIEPVRQTLSFGQVNLVLMLVVVADLCMPDSRWWKGAGVGIAAGIKLTPLIFIPYLLLTRRFRAAFVSTAVFALTIVGSLVALPKAAQHYWFEGLFLNPNRLGNVHYVGNQSLDGAVLRLFGSATAVQPYELIAAAAVGTAGLVLAAWASRRGQEMVGILVCGLTGLLVSPVSWSHHWVWVAPMLVVLADFASRPTLSEARLGRWACWLGAAATLVLFSGLLWLVPSPAVQGHVMTGSQQLIGDMYVIAGIGGLCVVASLLGLERRRDRLRSALATDHNEADLMHPGLAAGS